MVSTWYGSKIFDRFLYSFARIVFDVQDVRVKRGAELSIDHHLVVCYLRRSKPRPNKRSNTSSVTYRIKWEALEDKEVRKQFASSISSKFRQLPDVSEDIEKEWLLFRSAIISSPAESCGRKRLRVAGDSEKKHLGGTKRLNKLFEQRKMRSRPGYRTDCHLICNSGTLRREKRQLRPKRNPSRSHGKSLIVGRIPTNFQQTKYFGRPLPFTWQKIECHVLHQGF